MVNHTSRRTRRVLRYVKPTTSPENPRCAVAPLQQPDAPPTHDAVDYPILLLGGALWRQAPRRFVIQTPLIAFLPEGPYPLFSLIVRPSNERVPLPDELEQRHPESTRPQHHGHLQIEDLPGPGEGWEQGDELTPDGVAGMDGDRIPIGPEDERGPVKETPHQGHTRHLSEVRRRLILRSRDIQPNNAVRTDHAQRIHPPSGQR